MHEKVAIGTSTSLDDDEAIHETSVSFGVAMPAKQHKNNSNGYNRALSKTSKMYDMDGDGQLGKLMMVVSRILRVELLRWAPPQPSDLSRLFMYYKIGHMYSRSLTPTYYSCFIIVLQTRQSWLCVGWIPQALGI